MKRLIYTFWLCLAVQLSGFGQSVNTLLYPQLLDNHPIRFGVDVQWNLQITPSLLLYNEINWARPGVDELPVDNSFRLLSPALTHSGGCQLNLNKGFYCALGFRHMRSRPASEHKNIRTYGYAENDVTIGFEKQKLSIGFTIENVLNSGWRQDLANVLSDYSPELNVLPRDQLPISASLMISLRI